MQTQQVNTSVKATTVGEAVSGRKPTAALTGFLVLQMILGFEWFWSGLAKIMMPGGFPAALPGALGDMLQNSPPWYADFLTHIVIPHAPSLGT